MIRTGLLLILFGLGIVHAYSLDLMASIPDTAFLRALIEEGVDANGDGLISFIEAKEVTRLIVSGSADLYGGIIDMTGIEAFVNLDSLFCSRNVLSNLDVSHNIALAVLDCLANHLTNLDVSKNNTLTGLLCMRNLLTSLDISNNTFLTSLGCSENQLTGLSVSSNTSLTELYCDDNLISHLDVSENSGLERLWCGNNQLESLDVSRNAAIGGDCGRYCMGGIDLSFMPSLHNVCVWTTPFPPDTVEIKTTGSPNINFTTECDIGIEKQHIAGISIYPNPSTTLLTIEADTPETYHVEIIALNGKQRFNHELEGPTHQLDLSSFQSGVYLITIRSKDFVSTRKINKIFML